MREPNTNLSAEGVKLSLCTPAISSANIIEPNQVVGQREAGKQAGGRRGCERAELKILLKHNRFSVRVRSNCLLNISCRPPGGW